MQTSTQITIHAHYERIFTLGSEVERWGEILPHYRYVKLLKRDGERKLVKMSAWRDFIPVTWSAVETVVRGTEQEPGRILFHHVKGLVRGMDVEWSFTPGPQEGDWVVRIAHELENPQMPVRILGKRLIELVVGRGFIGNIAGKTLKRIKYLAEESESV